jgi:uncharacterized protein YcfL
VSIQDGKMGLNVIKFIIIFLLAGCSSQQGREVYRQEIQRRADVEAEARIDSAYAAMKIECDSLLVNKVPVMADSIINLMNLADSLQSIQK